MLTAKDITNSISKWPAQYETADGSRVIGEAVSKIPTILRENGWRRVSRLDSIDLKDLGCTIVKAQYVGGVRKTGKFIDIVVVSK